MGSDRHYPEEAPSRLVEVDSFEMDETPVTNHQFAQFVKDTGYVTFAERPPDPADYPGIAPEMIRAGSLLFVRPPLPVSTDDALQWWEFSFGACWAKPHGPDSSLDGIEDHPVVHVVHEDAAAFAAWAGKRLPTEAEWEFAARGGLDGADYAWGDELAPEGKLLANYWIGAFPHARARQCAFERTSPVGNFPANGYGLADMIGNVWEWTADWFGLEHRSVKPCCVPRNPRGASEAESIDPAASQVPIGRKVLKGGSHLCAANYCQRYRPAARYPQPVDTSTSHVGFRCAA